MLVDPDWVAARLADDTVRVVEADVSPAAFKEAHIPGAVLWDAYGDLRHADYTPISTLEFEELLSRSGIEPDTTIVFYGYAAHLAFFLMKALGHEQIRLMDGRRDRWGDSGRDWSTEARSPPQARTRWAPGPG